MNDGNCAPLDPIFWLHHANIDRLWNVWMAAGHVNPGGGWLNESFTFFDADGSSRTMAAQEVLDSGAQLGYVYDDVGPVFVPIQGVSVTEPPPPEFVGASEQPMELVATAASVPVTMGFVPQALLDGSARVLLQVDDIRADVNSGIGYAVYLNLPDDGDPATKEQHLVGSLSLFGIEQVNSPESERTGLTYVFDVTELVQTLAGLGVWDPNNVTVTVEPFDPVASSDVGEQESLMAQLPTVTIGRVSIFVG